MHSLIQKENIKGKIDKTSCFLFVIKSLEFLNSLYGEKFKCESITLFSKIRSLYGEIRYMESRYIERRLNGKV
jgi:hypothetical protein